MIDTNCTTCGMPTKEEQRLIVKTPEGDIQYYCMRGCADARRESLGEDKQFCTFEEKERIEYLKSMKK